MWPLKYPPEFQAPIGRLARDMSHFPVFWADFELLLNTVVIVSDSAALVRTALVSLEHLRTYTLPYFRETPQSFTDVRIALETLYTERLATES